MVRVCKPAQKAFHTDTKSTMGRAPISTKVVNVPRQRRALETRLLHTLQKHIMSLFTHATSHQLTHIGHEQIEACNGFSRRTCCLWVKSLIKNHLLIIFPHIKWLDVRGKVGHKDWHTKVSSKPSFMVRPQ